MTRGSDPGAASQGAFVQDGTYVSYATEVARMYMDPADNRTAVVAKLEGVVQPAVFQAWSRLIRALSPELILDVGSNYGEMVLPLLLGPNAAVHAFEPNPTVAEHLRRSVATHVQRDAFTVHAVAVSDQVGERPFNIDRKWSGTSSLDYRREDSPFKGDGAQHFDTVVVPVTSIDAFVGTRAVALSPDATVALKVDVEGHEPQVFAGARELLQRRRFFAIFEFSRGQLELSGFDAGSFGRDLAQLGRLHAVDRNGNLTPIGSVDEIDSALTDLVVSNIDGIGEVVRATTGIAVPSDRAPAPSGTARRPRVTKRGVVIGNCQAKPLAFALNYFSLDVEFEHFQVHSLPPHKAEDHIARRIAEFADVDLVLAFNLSDKYYGLATDRIAATFAGRPVLSINNLFFAGYHPDIVVLGEVGMRLDGALDQYHSLLALYAYLEEMTVEETVLLYRDEIYEALGYYGEWDRSAQRMLATDKTVDLPFAARYVDLLPQLLGMYVLNHPSPRIFVEWARSIVGALGDRGLMAPREWDPDISVFPSDFSATAIFPVYPELKAHHDLPVQASYVFKAKGYDASSFLSLEQFIAAEHEVFDRAGRDALRGSRQWQSAAPRFDALR